MEADRSRRWNALITRIAEEYRVLPASERQWIDPRLERIARLQQQLQDFFRHADGDRHCRICQGDCCAKGHNHMTLPNLLGYLSRGELPPPADFSGTCPFLGLRGCLLDVERRPYNCVTFICDTIENALSPQDIERFYSLDQQLRTIYLDFAARYRGAAMTGLLLQEQRLAGKPFFTLIEAI